MEDTLSDWVIESIQEILSKMNEEKRGLSPIPNVPINDGNTERHLQAISCSRTFGNGFHLQIPGRITTLVANLDTVERERGGFKVTHMQNGNLLFQVPSYGFMANVSVSYLYSLNFFPGADEYCHFSGRRKERHLVRLYLNRSYSRAYATG